MTSTGNADDIWLLLDEAEYRLRCAKKYDPLDDPRVLCENAHDAMEFSLNAVIVATARPYRRTHYLALRSRSAPV
jgi:HEPN domain-containing protein